ncbi:MAG: undecaprenyl-diphosphate phosphatase [Elusimicrobia bacterium]|nr:undecaprenyl-diphosphate phosphatase [Elusimicrobiota bacterium]
METTLGQVIILGVIQGITEFLPVSSDGHLTLFQSSLGSSESFLALDVVLHVGTLVSIVLFFWKDLTRLARGLVTFRISEGRDLECRRAFYIILATIPTAVIGFSLKKAVEGAYSSLAAAGVGFVVTAMFLAAGETASRREGRDIGTIPWWHAVLLGIVQGAAVWPGWSRSGSTIATALLLGWSWKEAGRFSFLMAIPAIAGATFLTLKEMGSLDPVLALTGGGVAFLAGLASLFVLMKFLAAKRLWPFAVYCALLGAWALFR